MKKIFLVILLFHCSYIFSQKAFTVKVYGKGQPVILIPGYACSGDVWNETVNSLKGKYELHVITIAGFAGVPPIDTPILATVKKELIEYVKQKHLNQPVLIGHSLGAFMSLWVASEQPGLFSKILCVDGAPFVPAMTNASVTAEQVKSNPSFNPETMLDNFKKLSKTAFENSQFKVMQTMVRDTMQARLIAQWSAASDPTTLAYTYVEMCTTDLREKIANINVPVLIIGSTYGTKDMSQKLLSEQYKLLPHKSIIIAPTKHFVMYDDPTWFISQTKNFLVNGLTN